MANETEEIERFKKKISEWKVIDQSWFDMCTRLRKENDTLTALNKSTLDSLKMLRAENEELKKELNK